VIDSFGRKIEYMRVSVTDRCNLRCKYCMPHDLSLIPHGSVLRYEEMLRLCAVAAKTGVFAFRVTGGEPLARKGCLGFLRELVKVPGVSRVTLTTNGVLLGPLVDELKKIGLAGVNLSLDTLNADTYRKITGSNEFPRVWGAFLAALDSGLRVKLNCVPLRGVNDGEIEAIAKLAEKYPVDVRFIELMPTSAGASFVRVPGKEILSRITAAYPSLKPDKSKRGMGPARYYKAEELKGSVGIINAIDGCFCQACNRVRLTSEGYLKTCLYHEKGVNLRDMLRGCASDVELESAFRRAVQEKPERHMFGSDNQGIKKMSAIGG
jgi:cyclic pyranopterin phosphate synthase